MKVVRGSSLQVVCELEKEKRWREMDEEIQREEEVMEAFGIPDRNAGEHKSRTEEHGEVLCGF